MAAADPVLEAARVGEPDRYIAALYAPEPARGRLLALAAFAAELARILALVREPMLAEIRLQWWREAMMAAARGEPTGHPIADRLGPDVASGLLPAGLLLGMIDNAAQHHGLDWADSQAVKSSLGKSEGAAFMLAARACGAGHSSAAEAAAQRAGYCYGLARRLAGHPPSSPAEVRQLADRCRAQFREAGEAVSRLDSALMPAFLPLTMAPAYLGAAERGRPARAMPLKRWWKIGRAALSGRVL